ncbi:hypothetical protein ACOSP7_019998 [Xanthoceras sorbifolium]
MKQKKKRHGKLWCLTKTYNFPHKKELFFSFFSVLFSQGTSNKSQAVCVAGKILKIKKKKNTFFSVAENKVLSFFISCGCGKQGTELLHQLKRSTAPPNVEKKTTTKGSAF